jgi:hypothetical protein
MQQAADKDAELLALLERSPNDLWNEDLDIFMKEWEVSSPCCCLDHEIECPMTEIMSRV